MMSSDTEQAIRIRAYEIWEQEGSPDGRDREHWQQAERELGVGPSDLKENPGIGMSLGTTEGDPEDIEGENTFEGDVLNDTTRSGAINPSQRGRTNK